ncbi:MAG: cold shock domain-containing protein [Actinomycetota bacterium]|nr:cold shock domain-containing protein [Actinomycetota bacterium]
MSVPGTVRRWHDDDGWGVIDSAATPGGCWAHFSAVAVAGYATLSVGQQVELDWEALGQDGFDYSAVRVWPASQQPVDREEITDDGHHQAQIFRASDLDEPAEQADVLVVDVANVLGSRPDGWWRDRAGATTRLLRRLANIDVAVPRLLVVLEGRARAAEVPPGLDSIIAPGSGDDALVDRVVEEVTAGRFVRVVTSDRGLRARLPAGVAVMDAGSLRRLLD